MKMKTYSRKKNTTVSETCRLCLALSVDLVPIFNDLNAHLAILVQNCLNIEISENDGLPSKMCQNCFTFMQEINAFKIKCNLADSWLRQQAVRFVETTMEVIAQLTLGNKDEAYNTTEINLPVIENHSRERVNSQLKDGTHHTDQFFDQPGTGALIINKFELIDACAEKVTNSLMSNLEIEMPSNTNRANLIEKEWTEDRVNQLGNIDDNGSEDVGIDTVQDKASMLSDNLEETPSNTNVGVFPLQICDFGKKAKPSSITGEAKLTVITCKTCGKEFSSWSSFSRHSLAVHAKSRRFRCTDCGRHFSDPSGLQRHSLIHLNLKPWECEYCLQRFRQKNYLKHHIQVHLDAENKHRSFSCSDCGKVYKFPSGLSRHKLSHQNLQFSCRICAQKFSDYSYFNKHENACKHMKKRHLENMDHAED